MIRYTLFVLATIAIVAANVNKAQAQESTYKGNVYVQPVRIEQQEDVLHIDFNIILNGVEIKSAKGLDFTPVLVAGDKEMELPAVSLKGNKEFLRSERQLALMKPGQKQQQTPAYLVRKGKQWQADTLEYRHAIAYQPWMEGATVEVKYDDCGCGQTRPLHAELLGKVEKPVPPVHIPYKVVPRMAYVRPETEERKNREIKAECFLDFVVNKTDIRPDYMNNPRELAKIDAIVNDLKADPNITIKQINIAGFASPEGSLANNKRLSEGRAKALQAYLNSQHELPKSIYQTEFGGENWDGLIAALDTVQFDHKDEVLAIVGKYTVEAGRKKQLMNLRAGQPYRYMLRNVYPALRVAVCRVDYEIRNFNLDEIAVIIANRPQNLSMNEMFLLANTYEQGSEQYAHVIHTAVQIYPKNEVANLNAAVLAIQRDDLESAATYINRIAPQSYPAQYNNIKGLLALLQKDYDAAHKHLTAAANMGLEEAKHNLAELKAAQDDAKLQ